MRKFKLIKEYPGSDPVGTIITGSKETMYSKGLGYRNYDWAHVETHPEYWEEVVERDYEIMTFNYEGVSYEKVDGGYSRVNGIVHTLESHLEDGVSKVHAVKRLSDGEIFTVGDKFKANIGGEDVIRTIQRIKVEGHRITIQHENGDLTNRKCVGIFNQIKKVKQPIFLTHNGIDIFEGDTVWYVNKENLYHDYAIALARTSFNSNTHAYFLTREGAEEYIRKNKVLFTTEDGVGISYGDEVWWVMDNGLINDTSSWNEGNNCYKSNRYFSTRATAENYIVENKYTLSIKDFWEFASWGGSSVAKSKRLKRLVKERLNIE
jgi:hypothetical protein